MDGIAFVGDGGGDNVRIIGKRSVILLAAAMLADDDNVVVIRPRRANADGFGILRSEAFC